MALAFRFHYLEPKSRVIQARDITDAQKQARMMMDDVNDRAKAAGAAPCVLTQVVQEDGVVVSFKPEKSTQSPAEAAYEGPDVA